MEWIVNTGDESNLPERGELIDVIYRGGHGAFCVPAFTVMKKDDWSAEDFSLEGINHEGSDQDIVKWRRTLYKQYFKTGDDLYE